jgi:hypothetical protein
MRRTRFERTQPGAIVQPPRELPRLTKLMQDRKPQVAALFRPMPKRKVVRSEALLVACRKIACQGCGARDGTICAAHSNWAVHGKGSKQKADDNRVASLCFGCHSELDQGKAWSLTERQNFWWCAHVETVGALRRLKLWPDDVPVPDTQTNPWAETQQAATL